MPVWSSEIKELEKLYESFKGQLPSLEKELEQLIKTDDANVIMLYSRRCLEVIITDLCECELKRSRGTEPLKGIIDKLHKERKVPDHISTSMHGLNDLSTYGTHPKDFDPAQVKPVLNNLDIIIKWYLRYKGLGVEITFQTIEGPIQEIKTSSKGQKRIPIQKNKISLILSGIILLVLVVIAVLYFTNTLGGDITADKSEKTIAVLPFKYLSDDPEKQYLADGMMDAIQLHLSRIKGLQVIAGTSVEKYRKTDKTSGTICNELGVSYLLEGSFQKFGDVVRLIVELKKSGKGANEWANQYDRKWNDILYVQSEVAQAIAKELNAIVTPQEKQLIEKISTENLDAYEAVLKGNFYLNKFTKNDLDTAMKYFVLAKEKDPKYSPAYGGISAVWGFRQQAGFVSPAEAYPKINEALMKAVELDSTVNLAGYFVWQMWDWDKGEKEFKKGIELNPNDADFRRGYSHLLIILGRNEEAMKQIEIAVKLDPVNAFTLTWYGAVLTFAHKYDEAIKAFQDALIIESDYPFAQGNLGIVLALSGRYKEALEQWKLSAAEDTELVNAYENGFKDLGFKGAVLAYNKVVELRFKNSYWFPWDMAVSYASIEEKDKALYWLEQAYKVRDPNLPYLLHPIFEKFHDDPRFKDLCQRMKLPLK